MDLGDELLNDDTVEKIVYAEQSNPGRIGEDTGYVFESPKTGDLVRVIARVGESRADAIKRVRTNHGLE